MRRLPPLIAAASVLLAACAKPSAPPIVEKSQAVVLERAAFADLKGWVEDDLGAALGAFRLSCAKLMTLPTERALADNARAPGGRVADWQGPCRAAETLGAADAAAARRFFEGHFTPYAVLDGQADRDPQTGLFTGYYVPELNGTWVRGGKYQTPLLARPNDLVSVNLGDFDRELGGDTIWGRVLDGKLRPYPDRRAIETGALGAKAEPLLWVDSSVDAFFLHVQGSGQVRFADGTVRQVGFAGKNGQPYRSIGKLLIDRGEIPADRLTMDSIRAWIEARPDAGLELLRENPSYVFFRLLEGGPQDGPLGAQGVALTAERSLAVDRRFLPLGAPAWLETHDPLNAAKPYNRLLVTQDTGGAIKGVVRGDVYFGAGLEAARRAGNMKRPGRYYILLPNALTP